jgi:hypothetical protein
MRWLASTAAEYVVRVAVLCPQETEERWTHAISALQQYVTRTSIQILDISHCFHRRLSTIVHAADEYSRRSIASRFLQHGRDSGDITRMKDDLNAAMDIFNVRFP